MYYQLRFIFILDIDECEIYSHGCTDLRGTCVNTVGSWSCVCDVGYDTYKECKGTMKDQSDTAVLLLTVSL